MVFKYARRSDAFRDRHGARGLLGLGLLLLSGACQLSILEGLDEGSPRGDGGLQHHDDGGLTCEGEACVLCENDELDAPETDVDCGGDSGCRRCQAGFACKAGSDCESGVCTRGRCAEASCRDDIKNGGETDVDCGGETACARCGAGRACEVAADCVDGVCKNGTCQPASCDDGVQNGGEPSVDCGGPCALEGALCSAGDVCEEPSDCSVGLCVETLCREPRGKQPWAIPGTIELENFDEGGAGVGYSDADSDNGGDSDYRDTDVDLISLGVGAGVAVSQTKPGEWLAFTSEIAEAGNDYNVELRALASGASGRARLIIGGQNIPLTIPVTAAANEFIVLEQNGLDLPAGLQLVQLLFESDGITADWLRFSRGAAPFGGKPHAVPGRIEAEDFNVGGEGVAYQAGGSRSITTPRYRRSDVDIDVCTDPTCASPSGTAFHVVDTKSGDWLEYDIEVRNAGTYALQLSVASNESGKRITVRVGDIEFANQRAVTNTGGWQKYTAPLTLSGKHLSAGRHTVRVIFEDGLVNFDWFSLTSM